MQRMRTWRQRVHRTTPVALLAILLQAGNALAMTVPASGSFAYDLYDIGVNQILLGPVGFTGGVACMCVAAILAIRQMILPAAGVVWAATLRGAFRIEGDDVRAIDGAGAVRRFFSITVPSIRPTIIFVIIIATIGGLQIFTEPKLFNAISSVPGGPQRQYQTTVLYPWDLAFNRQQFGRAAAVAWLLFLLIVAIGILNFMLSRTIASAESRAGRTRRSRKALS